MLPTDFPQMLAALKTPESVRPGFRFDPERRLTAWGETLASLAAAHAQGQIPNARFKEAADAVNSVLRRAWDRVGESLRGSWEKDSEAVRAIKMAGSPTWLSVERLLKRVNALPEGPEKATWKPFLEEAVPLSRVCCDLRGKTVKRVPRTAEEREAAKFTPPVSSSSAVARVQQVLTEAVDASFGDLVKVLADRNLAWLSGFQEALLRADGDPSLCGVRWGNRLSESYEVAWHFSNKGVGRAFVNTHALSVVSEALKPGRRPTGKDGWVVRRNAHELMEQRALKDAKEIRDYFIAKNLRKLVSILEAKGDDRFGDARVVGRHVDLRGLSGTLAFAFTDGSAFRAQNQVVYVVNSHGTQFLRFPLTFHDAVLPDGSTMPNPSEERMNTVFVQAASGEPVPSASARRRKP